MAIIAVLMNRCPFYFEKGDGEMKALKDQLREWKRQSRQTKKKNKKRS